jgi:hypothetical protein
MTSMKQEFPGLKEHSWPLCYILGAECDDSKKLQEVAQELVSAENPHSPQMIMLLDSG